MKRSNFVFYTVVLLLAGYINVAWGQGNNEGCEDCRKYMTERKLIIKSSKKILREHKFKEWEKQKKEIIPVIINLNISSEDIGTDIHPDMPLGDRIVTQQDRILEKLLKNKKVNIRYVFRNIPSISCEMPASLLKPLSQNSKVDSIEPIEKVELFTAQGIPLIGGDVYRGQYTGQGISIAIIDTGIDYNNYLVGAGNYGATDDKVKGGYDFADDDFWPEDFDGHGTSCAGIAAGDFDADPYTDGENFIGGVAYNSQLYALKVFSDSGDLADNDDIKAAIDWCVTKKQEDSSLLVISMSLGAGEYSSNCDSEAISYINSVNVANNANITLVAASGNDGFTDGIAIPSCLSNVISVGAVYDDNIGSYWGSCSDVDTSADMVTCYSNSASILNVLAPSNQANTTGLSGALTWGFEWNFGGTSAACPYVAGAVAVMQEAAKDLTGDYLSPSEVYATLVLTGDMIEDHRTGANNRETPRVNIAKAIQSMMYKVVPSAGSNGAIDPDYDIYVRPGGSKTFNTIPSSGYEVDQWIENSSVVQVGGANYTVSNVQGPVTLSVTFKPQSGSISEMITLTASATDQILSHWPDNPQSGSSLDIYDNTSIGGFKGNGFVKFNLSSIPDGSTVDSAELKMYCYSDDGDGEIDVNRSLKAWSESITWNTYYPATWEVLADETNRGGADFWWAWGSSNYPQLKSCVQGWINGSYSNYGFLITPGYMSSVDPIHGSDVYFWGVNTVVPALIPKLVITYTPPLPSLPDLIITNFNSVPDPVGNTYYVGQPVEWQVTVKNNSPDASADSSYLGYYLGNSPTDVGESTRIKTDTVDPLLPGESDGENHIHLFTNSDIGTKYLICKADNDNSIDETDENNNTWVYGPFTVQELGDLTVSIYPQEAVDDGAKWQVDGGTWRDSGYTETDLSVGQHTVEYQSTYYWNAPASHTVQINPGQTTSITKQYTRKADINLDDSVNLIDFSIMANRWQDSTCIPPDWCEQADIDKSGAVDFNDLLIMTEYWLTEGATVQADLLQNMEFETNLAGWTIGTNYPLQAWDVQWSEDHGGSAKMYISGAPSQASISQEIQTVIMPGDQLTVNVYHSDMGNFSNWYLLIDPGPSQVLLYGTGGPEGSDSITWTADQQYDPGTLISVCCSVWPGSSTTWVKSITYNPAQLNDSMVNIPAGTFQMGNSFSGEEKSDELPVHTVTLDSFSISPYTITNAQYLQYLNSAFGNSIYYNSNGAVYGSGDDEMYFFTSVYTSQSQISFANNTFSVLSKGGKSMANYPAGFVSWYGAVAYCNWRSQQEGYEQCYDLSTWVCDFSKNGYRLPTEAEWEYAARGGLSGKRFPWGDTISHSQANYYSQSSFSYDISPTRGYHPDWNDVPPYLSPIGSFSSNGFGLYDVAGNVREWCYDWYSSSYYSSSPANNPTGPTSGIYRVMRGGNFYESAGEDYSCRVDSRCFTWADNHYYHIAGFRMCRNTLESGLIAYYNSSSPTIDGVLSDGEWGSSYTVTMDRRDGGGQHDINLYFQQDGTYLFVGVDSQWGSGWDVYWEIFIDGDYSRTLNGNLSQPYTDIGICQQSPTGYPGYRAYRTMPDQSGVRVGFGSGADCASSGSTNVSYEFRVPLADLDVIPEASVGFTIAHGYDGISEHLYELSLSVSRTTPENWATLQIVP